MIKKYFLILILGYFSTNILAQSNFNAGASFNIGFPTGSFPSLAKTGIGGSIIGEYAFKKSFSIMLSGSYQNFPAEFEDVAVQGQVISLSLTVLPVLAGLRYYFNNQFFGIVEAGVHFIKLNAEAYSVYNTDKYSTDYKAKYGGSFGVGYRHQLAEASVFEITGTYQLVEDDFNSFSLKMGVLILLDNI